MGKAVVSLQEKETWSLDIVPWLNVTDSQVRDLPKPSLDNPVVKIEMQQIITVCLRKYVQPGPCRDYL
jgi:hypothetical protein